MPDNFEDVPVEVETQIIFCVPAQIEAYDVMYQKWNWDGIYAESVIFCNEDVAALTEEQIKKEVALCTALVKEGSQLTYKKGEKYTFVNFNFVTS